MVYWYLHTSFLCGTGGEKMVSDSIRIMSYTVQTPIQDLKISQHTVHTPIQDLKMANLSQYTIQAHL